MTFKTKRTIFRVLSGLGRVKGDAGVGRDRGDERGEKEVKGKKERREGGGKGVAGCCLPRVRARGGD